MNLFHPLKSKYNLQSARVVHPLERGRIPDDFRPPAGAAEEAAEKVVRKMVKASGS